MAVQIVTFVLGAVFALGLQFLAARLSLMREQARESWIRRLNSYQDFNTAAIGLAELWQAGGAIPATQIWDAVLRARKAAYDAALYDAAHPHLTTQMRELSDELVRFTNDGDRDHEKLERFIKSARAIWDDFADSDPALQRTSGTRWNRRRRSC